MKKIWYVLGVLIIGAGTIFLGYHFRTEAKPARTYLDNTPVEQGTSTPEVGQAAPQGFSPLFKEQILAYFPYASGTIAVDKAGRILQTDGKNEVALSSSSLPSIFGASASYDKRFILIASGENSSPQFRVWDSSKKIWRFLPSGISSPSFSPSTHQLVYLENTTGGERLSLSNLDFASSKSTVLATIPLLDLTANWISLNTIELKDKSSLLVPSSDFIFNMSRKTTVAITTGKNGLDVLWNPSGKTALTLLGQARGGRMFLINDSGEVTQDLNILTLPEKCAWGGEQNLFCALPQDKNAFKTVLPDNFYNDSVFTNDDFYKINTLSGDVSPVLENKNGLDAESLAVYGNSLYFINRLDEKLYSVPIPR